MRSRVRTLKLLLLAAAFTACSNDGGTGPGGETPVSLGLWAGGSTSDPSQFIILRTLANGANFRDNAQCMFGAVAQPLRSDEAGRFSAQAQLRRMAGPVVPARIEGMVSGNAISLRLTIDGQSRDYRLLLNGTIPAPRFVC